MFHDSNLTDRHLNLDHLVSRSWLISPCIWGCSDACIVGRIVKGQETRANKSLNACHLPRLQCRYQPATVIGHHSTEVMDSSAVAMVAQMKALRGHKSMASLIKTDLAAASTLPVNHRHWRRALLVCDSLRRPTSHLVARDYIRPLHDGAAIHSDLFSKCAFTFPPCINLVSTSIQGLTGYLIYWHGISHLSLQIKGPNLWKKKFCSG